MPNQIRWSKKAIKNLKKNVRKDEQKHVRAEIDKLVAMPDCLKVKALTDKSGYRLRVGDYRVLFEWHQVIQIIEIEEIKRRGKNTYG